MVCKGRRGGKVGGRSVKAAQIPTEPSSIQRELTPAAFVTRLCLALSETVTGILSQGGGTRHQRNEL